MGLDWTSQAEALPAASQPKERRAFLEDGLNMGAVSRCDSDPDPRSEVQNIKTEQMDKQLLRADGPAPV